MHFSVQTLVAVLAIAATGCQREPAWRGTPVEPVRDVPKLTFTDSTGTPVSMLPQTARAALVFFGYTNCPDICPTTLADWVRVKQALGDDAKLVRFVFVSVDPARDTPAVSQRYAVQFDSSFVGLSGSPETTVSIQNAFGVAAAKQESSSAAGYLVGHSAQSFLVDENGRVRVAYTFGAGWDAMSADVKQLLR